LAVVLFGVGHRPLPHLLSRDAFHLGGLGVHHRRHHADRRFGGRIGPAVGALGGAFSGRGFACTLLGFLFLPPGLQFGRFALAPRALGGFGLTAQPCGFLIAARLLGALLFFARAALGFLALALRPLRLGALALGLFARFAFLALLFFAGL